MRRRIAAALLAARLVVVAGICTLSNTHCLDCIRCFEFISDTNDCPSTGCVPGGATCPYCPQMLDGYCDILINNARNNYWVGWDDPTCDDGYSISGNNCPGSVEVMFKEVSCYGSGGVMPRAPPPLPPYAPHGAVLTRVAWFPMATNEKSSPRIAYDHSDGGASADWVTTNLNDECTSSTHRGSTDAKFASSIALNDGSGTTTPGFLFSARRENEGVGKPNNAADPGRSTYLTFSVTPQHGSMLDFGSGYAEMWTHNTGYCGTHTNYFLYWRLLGSGDPWALLGIQRSSMSHCRTSRHVTWSSAMMAPIGRQTDAVEFCLDPVSIVSPPDNPDPYKVDANGHASQRALGISELAVWANVVLHPPASPPLPPPSPPSPPPIDIWGSTCVAPMASTIVGSVTSVRPRCALERHRTSTPLLPTTPSPSFAAPHSHAPALPLRRRRTSSSPSTSG